MNPGARKAFLAAFRHYLADIKRVCPRCRLTPQGFCVYHDKIVKELEYDSSRYIEVSHYGDVTILIRPEDA